MQQNAGILQDQDGNEKVDNCSNDNALSRSCIGELVASVPTVRKSAEASTQFQFLAFKLDVAQTYSAAANDKAMETHLKLRPNGVPVLCCN